MPRDRFFLTMAEIGIQSTKAWEEFGPNIRVEVGSQADPEYLKGIKQK